MSALSAWLRRLFGLDFPDPQVGQVWRSRHSGRAVRVAAVELSDCGKLWHIDLQHEDERGWIPIPMSYCMFPGQWRRMLRDQGRKLMGGGMIEPSEPWPRTAGVMMASDATRPFTGALNDVPATLTHDEGAYAQCGECGRYTLNPNALTDRPPPCDCGSKHGWSGSFKRPGSAAKWSGLIQPAAAGALACPDCGTVAPPGRHLQPDSRGCPYIGAQRVPVAGSTPCATCKWPLSPCACPAGVEEPRATPTVDAAFEMVERLRERGEIPSGVALPDGGQQ